MTIAAFVITLLTYIVTGSGPPLIGHYLLRIRFLGGAWAASLVGMLGAVLAGLLDTVFLMERGDLIVLAGVVDVVPPLVGSIVLTVLFALVTASNG
ncbi:MAG: hypothetical protein ACOCVK_01345 [bacterium]